MADARFVRFWDEQLVTTQAAVGSGEIWQHADGRAVVYEDINAAGSGDRVVFKASGHHTITKTAGVVILDGGRVYWDHSANAATFRKVNDRDFYIGRAVGDAASADVTVVVNLNVDPPYDLDVARDPHLTAIVGTQVLTGLSLWRRGGAHDFNITATNEAQKLDILSKDGFAAGAANAIVEFAFNVVSGGAGTVVDVSLGIASATHATDADSIAQHLFLHLDANNVNINLQSKDGTTTVTVQDTTIDYTAGNTVATRVEVWFDCRNPADVQCYVNGVLVLASVVFDVSAAASTWFLLAHIEKTAATDTYELYLDWMRARFAEQ